MGGDGEGEVITLTTTDTGKEICKITLKKDTPFLSRVNVWDPKKHGYTLRFEFDVNIFRTELRFFFIDFFNCINMAGGQGNEIVSIIPRSFSSSLADYDMLKTANLQNMTAHAKCKNMITNDANIIWGSLGDRLLSQLTRKIPFLDEKDNVLDAYKTCTIVFRLTTATDKNGISTEVRVIELNKLDTFYRPCGVRLNREILETESQYLHRYEYNKNSSPSLPLPPVLDIRSPIEEVLKKISADNPCLKTYFEKLKISVTSSQMTPPTPPAQSIEQPQSI